MTQSAAMTEWSGPAPNPVFAPTPRPERVHTIVAAVLSVVFLAATATVAILVHNAGSGAAAAGAVGPVGVPASPGVAVDGGAGASTPAVGPSPATTRPLRAPKINRAFRAYMNALLHHNLTALHAATCPRLRHTEVGFALHGKYVHAWRGRPYEIQPALSNVTVRASVQLTDPATGGDAGRALYGWNVQRNAGGHYYVCGFLS